MKTLTTFLLLLFALPVYAIPGSSWLELGPGGRAAALGEAVTASVDGATSTYWNPAAMNGEVRTLEIMQNNWWVEGGSSQFIGGSFPVNGRLVLGASALHVGIGNLDLRDGPSASPIGTFDARNFALGGSFAYRLTDGLRAGATVRYLSESIYVDHANGWSFDFGVLQQGMLGGSLDLGATIRHLGRIEALRQTEYSLPTTVSAGGVYRFGSFGIASPSLMVEAGKVVDHDPTARAGLEIGLFEYLSVRSGYQAGIEGRSFTAGFGLRYEQWRFDYGYTPFRDDLGAAQRFSAGVVW